MLSVHPKRMIFSLMVYTSAILPLSSLSWLIGPGITKSSPCASPQCLCRSCSNKFFELRPDDPSSLATSSLFELMLSFRLECVPCQSMFFEISMSSTYSGFHFFDVWNVPDHQDLRHLGVSKDDRVVIDNLVLQIWHQLIFQISFAP